MTEAALAVDLGGIRLRSPVLAASGTFGYGREYEGVVDMDALGGIVVKGTSLEPWPGNPPPRVAETPSGMLNAIGLQNPGVEHFLAHDLEHAASLGPRIIVNVAGRTVEEYVAVAGRLDGVRGVAGLEINISCPNVTAGGLAFGTDADATHRVVRGVREATSLPLLVKLSPNVTDITAIARAAEEAGADALSLINTLVGMLIDTEAHRPLLGNVFGGLSGPAVMPVALRMVWQVAGVASVPILASGGITSADSALQFIMAGARAVAVGTGLFYDPRLPRTIVSGLSSYMAGRGLTHLSELEGAARGKG